MLPGYTVLERLGVGGSSVVYRARQDNLQRDVAVKLIRQEVYDAGVWRRFEREARIIAALSGHPHVVTVYDVGRTERGEPFLVTELLDRGSLSDIVATRGPLDVESVVAVGRAVASALSAAHGRGILHRDVKPGNVLVDSHRQIKLGDFGVARLMAGHTQTTTASVAFTPEHVAPEVLRGEPEGPASDVYGLGSTLMTALTGRSPFARRPDERVEALMWRKLAEPAPAPPPSTPPALAGLLTACLATAPEQRPSLDEVDAELARVLARTSEAQLDPAVVTVRHDPVGASTTRAPLPPPEPAAPASVDGEGEGPDHDRRGRWVGVAAVALLVVFLTGLAAYARTAGDGDGDAASSTTGAPATAVDGSPLDGSAAEQAPAGAEGPGDDSAAASVEVPAEAAPTTPTPTTAAPPAPTPTPTAAPAPTTAASAPPPPPGRGRDRLDDDEAVAFVQDYYEAVNAGRYEEAWARLSPEFRRARSLTFERYVDYWRSTSIELSDVRSSGSGGDGRQVRFDARYVTGDRVVEEANELEVRRGDDGQLVITGQRIVD